MLICFSGRDKLKTEFDFCWFQGGCVMPGFFISNSKMMRIHDCDDSRCLYEKMKHNEWNIQRNTLNKFLNDKLFAEFDDSIIILDGIILNKNEIEARAETDNWAEIVHQMYLDDEAFFSSFRGCFAGAVYNKTQKKWIIFTDQVSNHSVFVYSENGKIAIGTRINYFVEWMKENKIQRALDGRWVNDLFYYGYVMDSHSIIHSVKRLFPGSYCVVSLPTGSVEEITYYKVVKTDQKATDEEWIEQLESAFQNAVDRIQKKCDEYNYTMLVDISGGLDSRMIAAHISPTNVQGMCFAESGSLDQLISRKVAKVVGIPIEQYYMDEGECLYEIDDLVKMNQGMSYYAGITGGKKMLENFDKNRIGIEINGLLGDVYDGAMITDAEIDKLIWTYDRYKVSRKFVDEIDYKGYNRDYADNELLWFYCRGMIVGQSPNFIRQNYCEGVSPYGDVEYMNLLFSIPYEKRTEGRLLQHWLRTKYPEMARIQYSGTGVRITKTSSEEAFRIFLFKARRKIKNQFIKDSVRTRSMNPVDYWYEHKTELREVLDRYYLNNINELSSYAIVKKRVEKLYESDDSTAMEKILALTIISAVKQYIN